MTPRPARVAIVIGGGEHWSYWARRALHRADRVWGGSGFAVVPHRDGNVDPVLLRACAVYDPDFVVTYSPTVDDFERLRPGSFQVRGEDGELLTGGERERMFDMARMQPVPVEADERARTQITQACSPYRTKLTGAGWTEDVTTLDEEPGRSFPDVMAVPGTWQGPVLACPPQWGGVLGAAVANRAGVAAAPDPGASEPILEDAVLNQLTGWLLDAQFTLAPDELIWHPDGAAATSVDTGKTPTAHQRSERPHLAEIAVGIPVHRTGLLVVGDTPEDFALARMWKLTFGTGYWLPSVLGFDRERLTWSLAYGVDRIATELRRHANDLVISSVSRSIEDLTGIRDRLLEARPVVVAEGASEDPPIRVVAASALPWRQPMTVQLAVAAQYDSIATVPTAVDEDGTCDMAAPLPPPALTDPELTARPELTWQVDVSWPSGQAVRGRGLDGQEVFTPDTAKLLTWGRSGRNGIVYQSHRYNFVPAGIRAENKLARPALRDLSLAAWVRAKAREHDLVARPSDAGQRATLLMRMLGGRASYVELFGGPLLPALRAMVLTNSSTDKSYPDGGGVALSSTEGVLTFAGVCANASGLEGAEVRGRLDAALRAGVVRRGLVVQCQTCEQKQFRTVDQVGQRWRCMRCNELSDLDRQAWKLPLAEPLWFYDLHPVGRQVLQDNGDVPAMLSAYLRAERNDHRTAFHDVEEIVFLKGNNPQVEVDLVAYTDDALTVAECKRAGTLTNKELGKKCRAAASLRADRLMFATKATSWPDRVRTRIESAVNRLAWGPLGPPRVVLVAGLGTSAAHVDVIAHG